MLTARTTLLAKTETGYGTDVTPTGLDGVLAMNVKPDVRFQSLIRNVQKSTLGKYAPVSETGGNTAAGGISFDVELRGAGSAYSTAILPKIDPLLKACGLTGTIVAGTSVTYTPISTGISGCTIYTYLDGVIAKLIGCRGNAKLSLKAGQPAVWTFDMQALTIAFTDGALVPGTYESGSPTPPPWTKYGTFSSFMTGAILPAVTAVDIDFGNSVQVATDANKINGRGRIDIVERDIQGTFDPELVLIATYDWHVAMQSATQIAGTVVVGTAANNKCTITLPRMVLGQIGHQDRSGSRALSIPFKAAESAGDDEITILFN
jgi:hypothetical protein